MLQDIVSGWSSFASGVTLRDISWFMGGMGLTSAFWLALRFWSGFEIVKEFSDDR